jgi:tetratricopeptide (TPR) repeat protein
MRFSAKKVSGYFRSGDFAAVDRACSEEIAINPGNSQAWHFRGIAAIRMKEFGRAVQYILRAIFHFPGECQMHVNLGIALKALNRWDEAVSALSEATKLDPSNFEAQLLLASAHVTRNEFAEAGRAATAALNLRPQSAEAWDIQATIDFRLAEFERARAAAKKAIAINPVLPNSHRIIADVLMRREAYERAEHHYLRALKFAPDDSEIHGNFGLLLNRVGRYAESVEQYRTALNAVSDGANIRYGLAIALLALGRLEEGWPFYAARGRAHKREPLPGLPTLERPPAPGERVLVTTDQGPGEQIMFASLLSDLAKTRAELTVTCDERLVALFQRSFPDLSIAGRDQPLTAPADYQISLGDTAKWLRPPCAAFPTHDGYLKADPYMAEVLRAKYAARRPGNLLVGISWRTIQGAKVSAQKTVPLERWGPILSVPGVTFISLQYGECEEELRAAEAQFGIPIVRDEAVNAMLDLDSLAAQIAAMDLVITTSNTTAHLAGALNVPTWVFVPSGYGGFWHWFLERNDSPWYPSVRLFRQSRRGDWQTPLNEAAVAFAGFAETHRAAP